MAKHELRVIVKIPNYVQTGPDTAWDTTDYRFATWLFPCPGDLAEVLDGTSGNVVIGAELVTHDAFAVRLIQTGEKKISVIKAIRVWTGLGLKEAKEASETTPIVLYAPGDKDFDFDQAGAFLSELEACGATATIVPAYFGEEATP